MMQPKNISTYFSKAAISLVLALAFTMNVSAQKRTIKMVDPNDSVPTFNGVSVGVDLAGIAMLELSDYGQYEVSGKVNIKNKYFPTLEVGYGKSDHTDDATNINYKAKAPYFKIGCDVNILKNKRQSNRMTIGMRYAFTSFKDNVDLGEFRDPVWAYPVKWQYSDNSCNYHWLEFVVGIEAQILGPVHLGWTVRYCKRLAHNDGVIGNAWYVPGFGKAGNARLGATFNLSVDI